MIVKLVVRKPFCLMQTWAAETQCFCASLCHGVRCHTGCCTLSVKCLSGYRHLGQIASSQYLIIETKKNKGYFYYLTPSSAAECHLREMGYGTTSVMQNSRTLKAGESIAHCGGKSDCFNKDKSQNKKQHFSLTFPEKVSPVLTNS